MHAPDADPAGRAHADARMLNSSAMRMPPADLVYLRDQFRELASQVHEHWESSALADTSPDSPGMLGDAMAQLIDMLSSLTSGGLDDSTQKGDINTLGAYGLQLLEDLTDIARQLNDAVLAAEIERLSLPLALCIARHDGEIRNLAPVVNAIAQFANQTTQPQFMSELYTYCCELIEAASPTCEEHYASDGRHPWRLLLLNRAIVATRSLNPELMTPAFDAIVEQLPDEAQRFFAEGMEQMTIIDYPDPVREVMQRYFSANSAPRRLH